MCIRDRWKIVHVDGLAPRSVGLAYRRWTTLPAPARAVQEAIARVVNDRGAQQPGLKITVAEITS